jgi:hypothetical protein
MVIRWAFPLGAAKLLFCLRLLKPKRRNCAQIVGFGVIFNVWRALGAIILSLEMDFCGFGTVYNIYKYL